MVFQQLYHGAVSKANFLVACVPDGCRELITEKIERAKVTVVTVSGNVLTVKSALSTMNRDQLVEYIREGKIMISSHLPATAAEAWSTALAIKTLACEGVAHQCHEFRAQGVRRHSRALLAQATAHASRSVEFVKSGGLRDHVTVVVETLKTQGLRFTILSSARGFQRMIQTYSNTEDGSRQDTVVATESPQPAKSKLSKGKKGKGKAKGRGNKVSEKNGEGHKKQSGKGNGKGKSNGKFK